MSVRAWRIWCEVLGLRPNFTFTLLGGVNPSAGAFKDNAPFKLGNGGEDVKHQLAARCRGVYVLGERTEVHAAPVKVFHDGYQVAHAAASRSSFHT